MLPDKLGAASNPHLVDSGRKADPVHSFTEREFSKDGFINGVETSFEVQPKIY